MWIERTSFENIKIYWNTIEEQIIEINNLKAKTIISVSCGTPDMTPTKKCSDVYYEYYIN